MMIAVERRARITEHISAHGAASVSDLVALFGVSDMTIRRDLDALAAEGTAVKVHGGAIVPAGRRAAEPGFDAKLAQMRAQKLAVATAAAVMVQPRMSVGLSGGTTAAAVAEMLLSVPQLTVVTNSVRVSDQFQSHPRPDRTVILTGGIRTPSDALVGPVAEAALRNLHTDIAFIGAHGISEHAGCTTPQVLEASTNRALMAVAEKTAVVSDSSKWGVVGVVGFADLEEIDALIIDSGLPSHAQRELNDRVGRLQMVDCPPVAEASTDSGGEVHQSGRATEPPSERKRV
ncbi:DeoR/GlpR family DNA-binding transcription regulator [Nesterenkonia muleiensis]|uniref:DeoR/GlpR family DNA-binding transcription regulator n=1 Tax=Nesterenkonia muleiensis TaxID=2282648 RepID=UPI00192E4DEE|nr:DeoR/GlpR family DNA-binding transcription regulator [Nesterenkonia muleiensis]